jgi:hypothetical protein
MVGEVAKANEKGWITHTTIDYDRPPRSYRNAMSRVDREEWLEAYRVEEQGSKDRDVFSIVVPPPNPWDNHRLRLQEGQRCLP